MTNRVPGSVPELSAIISDAFETSSPLRLTGNDSKGGYGYLNDSASQVSLAGLRGITLYEPNELVIGAWTGTPLDEIEQVLKGEGQQFSFEPMRLDRLYGNDGNPTIGGMTACNLSGPRRIQAGAARDSLIGIEAINGRGEVFKSGGRVMKNVTGYDLVKLLCGSLGILGAITKVNYKLMPCPEMSMTLWIQMYEAEQAVALFHEALKTPFDITGAAYVSGENSGAMLRIEGFEASVRYRMNALKERLSDRLKDHEINEFEGEASHGLWRAIRDVDLLNKDTIKSIWKISTKPSVGARVINAVCREMAASYVLDWAGGLVWLGVHDDLHDGGAQQIRHIVDQVGGHATLMKATDDVRRTTDIHHPRNSGVGMIEKLIKQRFDPANILNPETMGII